MFDMKLIGTPQFRHKEDFKIEQAKKQEELFESRKAKSTYEAVAGNGASLTGTSRNIV